MRSSHLLTTTAPFLPNLPAEHADEPANGSKLTSRRAVVVLHELDERPVAEIATLLRIARVTVRWHLAAGRKQLAAYLSSGGSHEG